MGKSSGALRDLPALYAGARMRLETALYDWRLSVSMVSEARRLAELAVCADEMAGIATQLATNDGLRLNAEGQALGHELDKS